MNQSTEVAPRIEMLFHVMGRNVLPEFKPFIMALARTHGLSNVTVISFVPEVYMNPDAYGAYDKDTGSIVIATEKHLSHIINSIENNNWPDTSLRAAWLYTIFGTICHEVLHADGFTHDTKDLTFFEEKSKEMMAKAAIEYDVQPVVWGEYFNRHITGILDINAADSESLKGLISRLHKMEIENLWFLNILGDRCESFRNFMKYMSPIMEDQRWHKAVTNAEVALLEEKAREKEEKEASEKAWLKNLARTEELLRQKAEEDARNNKPLPEVEVTYQPKHVEQALLFQPIDDEPTPQPVYQPTSQPVYQPTSQPVYEGYTEDDYYMSLGNTGEYSPEVQPTQQVHTVQPQGPMPDKDTMVRHSNIAKTAIIRMVNHIFTKCGFCNTGNGFTTPEAVLEPLYLGDIQGLNEVFNSFTYGDGLASIRTEPLKDRIVGEVFKNTRMPAYVFSINVKGSPQTWKVIPQNINKTDAKGNLKKSAMEARNGKAIAWILRGKAGSNNAENFIGSVKAEPGVGFVFSWMKGA